MKNKYILAAMGAMMLYAGQAYAITQTKPMQVSLNNIAAVTVSTSAVNFGDITTNTLFPTATGSITVNATIGAVYTISIDAGQHQSNVNGVSRNVSASLTVQRAPPPRYCGDPPPLRDSAQSTLQEVSGIPAPDHQRHRADENNDCSHASMVPGDE